jgi:hypothetical protein
LDLCQGFETNLKNLNLVIVGLVGSFGTNHGAETLLAFMRARIHHKPIPLSSFIVRDTLVPACLRIDG